jgi:hypothetical protein
VQNLEMEIKFFVMLGTQGTLLRVNLEFREEKVHGRIGRVCDGESCTISNHHNIIKSFVG